jgi:hypothetical protein
MNPEILQANKRALEEFLMDIEILDQLERKISGFNAFETMGVIHTEIRHSNVLAWLLNPIENHALGEYFIKKVVQTAIYNHFSDLSDSDYNPFRISLIEYHDFLIRREWRNIDILAVSETHQFVIAIENKVWSNESDHQLRKYHNIIQEEYPNYKKVFIYLTPYGDESSDPNTWLAMSYETMISIIEKGKELKKESMSERVRLFIEQYLEILRRYIVGDNELEKICRDIYFKHKKALDLIFEYKPDIYSDISEHLQCMIRETPHLILDGSGKTYIRFTTEQLDKIIKEKGNGWTSSGRVLLFEFQNRSGRLALKLLIGPGENDFREHIFKIAKESKQVFKGASKKNNKQFTQIYSKELLPKQFEEELEYEDILNQITRRFNKFIENELAGIEKVFVQKMAEK